MDDKKTGEKIPEASGPDWDNGTLVFHYSREHRLSRSSPAVREFNEVRPPVKTGLFRSLTATKPLAFCFISIVTVCAAMSIYSIFFGDDAVKKLENVELRLQARKAGEKSYITLRKKILEGDSYTGAVDIAVSSQPRKGGESSVHTERLYFSLEEEETFRFTVPFSGKTLLVLAVLDESPALFKLHPR